MVTFIIFLILAQTPLATGRIVCSLPHQDLCINGGIKAPVDVQGRYHVVPVLQNRIRRTRRYPEIYSTDAEESKKYEDLSRDIDLVKNISPAPPLKYEDEQLYNDEEVNNENLYQENLLALNTASSLDEEESKKTKVAYFLTLYPEFEHFLKLTLTTSFLNAPTPAFYELLKFIQSDTAFIDSIILRLFQEPNSFNLLLKSLITNKDQPGEISSLLHKIPISEFGDLFRLIRNAALPKSKWKKTRYVTERISNKNSEKFDIQALISSDDKNIVITFPGTKSLNNLFLDFQVYLEDAKKYGLKGDYKIHSGFLKAFSSIKDEVLFKLKNLLENSDIETITFNGHSLGGGLAYLMYMYTDQGIGEFQLQGIETRIITFGTPPYGNSDFTKETEKVILRRNTITANFRFYKDIIAEPPRWVNSLLNLKYPYGKTISLSSLDWSISLNYDNLNHQVRSYAFAVFMVFLDNLKDGDLKYAHEIFIELLNEKLINKRRNLFLVHLLRFGKEFFIKYEGLLSECLGVFMVLFLKSHWGLFDFVNPLA